MSLAAVTCVSVTKLLLLLLNLNQRSEQGNVTNEERQLLLLQKIANLVKKKREGRRSPPANERQSRPSRLLPPREFQSKPFSKDFERPSDVRTIRGYSG